VESAASDGEASDMASATSEIEASAGINSFSDNKTNELENGTSRISGETGHWKWCFHKDGANFTIMVRSGPSNGDKQPA
jgi:hypothetical protein